MYVASHGGEEWKVAVGLTVTAGGQAALAAF
jgi:hypothetical protein